MCQLRGRVGRGAAASACVLLYSTNDSGRLGETAGTPAAMAETNDGFEIARRDLEIRGPGEFLGARQSGARCCALPIWRPIPTCSSGRGSWPR
jgi:ATP-dependent DNA helicase RecG